MVKCLIKVHPEFDLDKEGIEDDARANDLNIAMVENIIAALEAIGLTCTGEITVQVDEASLREAQSQDDEEEEDEDEDPDDEDEDD